MNNSILKSELKLFERLFGENHDRFQFYANVLQGEIRCVFKTSDGTKVEVNGIVGVIK